MLAVPEEGAGIRIVIPDPQLILFRQGKTPRGIEISARNETTNENCQWYRRRLRNRHQAARHRLPFRILEGVSHEALAVDITNAKGRVVRRNLLFPAIGRGEVGRSSSIAGRFG
jgi:hypothetical protein